MQQSRTKGIISIIISAFGFAGMAFFVKLSGDLPVMEKAIFRNLIASFVAFVMMRREGIRFHVGKENRWTMALRCTFGTLGILCNFWALRYLTMGDASILQKMSPFFSIVMSIFILGEKPDRTALISVFLALIGAAFVVKPTSGLVGLPALIGLAGGFAAGTAYTFVRKLGLNGVKGPVIVFCFSVSSVLVMLPFMIVQFQPMTAFQFVCLLMAGICASVGQIFVTRAYSFAPANQISVFDYTQVLFAALLGFVFLREVPDVYSVIGYVIIIGTAVWKWYVSSRQ